MALIYTICIKTYYTFVRIVGLIHKRAYQLIVSRKLSPLRQDSDKSKKNLWIHCASHGEYETAKPLIKRYKYHFNIHLTFYSPSGYNVAKNQEEFWTTLRYLAFDHSIKVDTQISDIDPHYVIFVQYEYWYNLLNSLNQKSIPFVYYGVQLNEDHLLTKSYASFLKKQVNQSQLILTRDEESQSVAQGIFNSEVTEVGDVRWLQANSTLSESYTFPFDKSHSDQTIVLGSAWKEDMLIWQSYIKEHPNTLFIIAPHDISQKNVESMVDLLPSQPDIWADRNGNRLKKLECNVLIVNVLGELKYLYRVADIAYIGGGLGSGLHNCIEAAVYSHPVIISGDGMSNPEAKALIDAKLAYPIQQAKDLEQIITKVVTSHDKTKAASYLAAELKKSQHAFVLIDRILNV